MLNKGKGIGLQVKELMAIRKSDLYSSIWASCDQLRGGMEPSEYKNYVLFMLFIKYVSDKYADLDEFETPIVIPAGASFKDMVALRGKGDIGDRINKQVIAPLIKANSQLAGSDFPDFNDKNKLGDGKAMVERLSNLIGIFDDSKLNFAANRADHDDILGDAYEYLMRHFATESGKSKGQFYTPAEVSRVIAKVLGIAPNNTTRATTAYDPTCGSGSLLLKVAAEAGKEITLEGQEKESATASLARMNMILHGFPTADIQSGGEGTLVNPRFLDAQGRLRTYDYVVANPPFSDKAWSLGMGLGDSGSDDRYQRFSWGVPPDKQGDYAYLLHIIRSMKHSGKAACILPHGVLFRGNAEADIRKALVQSGILKGIIGLPANLFYGTGIPACILLLDKENASTRKGIFMIDASKGFRKDGAKNRLREQDIHKIVDTFRRLDDSDPRYARMVSLGEISNEKNDYNLNLPRYIDSTEPEDVQDIQGHLTGGIPERDLDALGGYWRVMPTMRADLFAPTGRAGYCQLRLAMAELKPRILGHAEFEAYRRKVMTQYAQWQTATVPDLNGLGKGSHPKVLIATISERLLATFAAVPLIDGYDVYQHLMDFWDETMQDDVYLIADLGWQAAATLREIVQEKNKDNKLVWPEAHDFVRGKRRYKSDLIPSELVVARYFGAERDAIAAYEAEAAAHEQARAELFEEESGEDGRLSKVLEGEDEARYVSEKMLKERLKAIGHRPADAEERQTLEAYAALTRQRDEANANAKHAKEALAAKLEAKYGKLSADEIKTLVVDDKWLGKLNAAVQGELERVSQTLTGRIRQLAKRYATTLPQLNDEVAVLAACVDAHLRRMGAVWM